MRCSVRIAADRAQQLPIRFGYAEHMLTLLQGIIEKSSKWTLLESSRSSGQLFRLLLCLPAENPSREQIEKEGCPVSCPLCGSDQRTGQNFWIVDGEVSDICADGLPGRAFRHAGALPFRFPCDPDAGSRRRGPAPSPSLRLSFCRFFLSLRILRILFFHFRTRTTTAATSSSSSSSAVCFAALRKIPLCVCHLLKDHPSHPNFCFAAAPGTL